MKIKKLALALGTVMMMSLFGMTASAVVVDYDYNHNTEATNNTRDRLDTVNNDTTLKLCRGTYYYIDANGAMNNVKKLVLEYDAHLYVYGTLNLDNCDVSMDDNSRLIVTKGGKITGSVASFTKLGGEITTCEIDVYFNKNASCNVQAAPQATGIYKNFILNSLPVKTVNLAGNEIDNKNAITVIDSYSTKGLDDAFSLGDTFTFKVTETATLGFAKWLPSNSTETTFKISALDVVKGITAVFDAPDAIKASRAATATTASAKAQGPMTVQLKKTSFTVNGKKAIKPSIKAVKVNGKKIAKKYYKVSYKNNKKAGKAQVIVTGKGKYKAFRATVDFTINPAKAKFSKVKASKNAITASWKKQNGIVGYEVQYSTNRKFTDAKSVYTTGFKATKTTIKNLTSKTKVYVRVRAAVVVDNKNAVFGNWSAVKKVTVK